MRWVENHGADLPVGSLTWVDHPVHGVVWAEKVYVTAVDEQGIETKRWTWAAYGAGEMFPIEEATRYQLVPRPGSSSEQWLSRQDLIDALNEFEKLGHWGDTSGMARWFAKRLGTP